MSEKETEASKQARVERNWFVLDQSEKLGIKAEEGMKEGLYKLSIVWDSTKPSTHLRHRHIIVVTERKNGNKI